MNKTQECIVTNRSGGMVYYVIPERHIRRQFAQNETKRLTIDEIEALTFQPGGKELLMNFLQVDPVSVEKLNMPVEPEYALTPDQIKTLLSTGSLDAFLDALDFAPQGVIDLIKQFSVELPLTDMNKVKALKDKTGFDVLAAINNEEAVKRDTAAEISEEKGEKKRRTQPQVATSGRRTTPKYKVVESK